MGTHDAVYKAIVDQISPWRIEDAVYQAVSESFKGVRQGVIEEVEIITDNAEEAFTDMVRPSVLYRPRIFVDGRLWCALYGDNLQDGVAGFGESPAAAMRDFDKKWKKKLPE